MSEELEDIYRAVPISARIERYRNTALAGRRLN
jgi:hypothetical protein